MSRSSSPYLHAQHLKQVAQADGCPPQGKRSEPQNSRSCEGAHFSFCLRMGSPREGSNSHCSRGMPFGRRLHLPSGCSGLGCSGLGWMGGGAWHGQAQPVTPPYRHEAPARRWQCSRRPQEADLHGDGRRHRASRSSRPPPCGPGSGRPPGSYWAPGSYHLQRSCKQAIVGPSTLRAISVVAPRKGFGRAAATGPARRPPTARHGCSCTPAEPRGGVELRWKAAARKQPLESSRWRAACDRLRGARPRRLASRRPGRPPRGLPAPVAAGRRGSRAAEWRGCARQGCLAAGLSASSLVA